MNNTLSTASFDEILDNRGLYSEMVRIMTAVDGKQPKGSCCGRNKETHIKEFISNRQKYIKVMENIEKRTIEPKWKGILFISKAGRHFDSKTMTDETAKKIIAAGWLSPAEKYFNIPASEKAGAANTEKTVSEEPKQVPVEETKTNTQTSPKKPKNKPKKNRK